MGSVERPRRLGRGLSSLLGEPVKISAVARDVGALPASIPHSPSGPEAQVGGARLLEIPLDQIVPNRFQPRQEFDDAGLQRLAASIRTTGVMQPIAVRPLAPGVNNSPTERWELVAGERRWRAAKLAGLSSAPALATALSDRESAEWSLVENLQREDLNAMERARAFRALCERFGLSHGEVAERVGLERPTVANLIRLTELEARLQSWVEDGSLSAGHARALLALPAGDARERAGERARSAGWSVRRLEAHVNALLAPEGAAPGGGGAAPTSLAAGASRGEIARRDLERRLSDTLGTRVRIAPAREGTRGHIRIEYFDLDHLDALLARLGVRPE